MDDAYPSEREDARQLVDSCPDCAALAADIRQLASATSQLPAAKRTRDFTITAEQAEKLSGSRLSRWLRGLTAPGWGALRPVAGAALSIGIVMVAVGVALPHPAPANQTFGSNSPVTVQATPEGNPPPAAPGAGGFELTPAPASGAEATMQVTQLFPSATGDGVRADQPGAALDTEKATENPDSAELNQAYAQSPPPVVGGDNATPVRNGNTTSDLLIYGGLLIALVSAALLGLAWFARRRFADPLLR
jgi:hypothetical protein